MVLTSGPGGFCSADSHYRCQNKLPKGKFALLQVCVDLFERCHLSFNHFGSLVIPTMLRRFLEFSNSPFGGAQKLQKNSRSFLIDNVTV